MELEACDLVPGDIVDIEIGDNVPADCVIIRSSEMKVNNSSLTGESEELLRVADEKAQNIFESPNVAFFGTACVNGSGTGIVFKTGDNTVIGQIANLADTANAGQTPIAKELDRFIKIFTCMAIIFGIITFCLGFAYGSDFISDFVFVIGIIVSNIPEGLLITMTVVMALTA